VLSSLSAKLVLAMLQFKKIKTQNNTPTKNPKIKHPKFPLFYKIQPKQKKIVIPFFILFYFFLAFSELSLFSSFQPVFFFLIFQKNN
jgi:hypothetical protein